jgi:hypothetical protein
MLNKATRKAFSSNNFKISFRTRNNAFNMIQKRVKKDSTTQVDDKFKKSGIYKLTCSDCKCYYIGQTGRQFQCRFKEHIQALKSNNSTTQKSNFAEHLLQTGHNYKSMQDNMTILSTEHKGHKMNAKEELYIHLNLKEDHTNIINAQQTLAKNPIFDKIWNMKYKK